MARILISESHPDVCRLLERMVTRLGHEAIVVGLPAPEVLLSADALVVEPAAPVGAVLAQTSWIVNPNLAIVCVSVAGPPEKITELGVRFAAALVKPFTVDELAVAIDQALAVDNPIVG